MFGSFQNIFILKKQRWACCSDEFSAIQLAEQH